MPLPWSKRRTSELAVSLSALQDALAEGWSIDSPAHRRHYLERPDGEWLYDVIMWRGSEVKVLTLCEEPALCEFLARSGVPVEAV